jgi:hypothetical protein
MFISNELKNFKYHQKWLNQQIKKRCAQDVEKGP